MYLGLATLLLSFPMKAAKKEKFKQIYLFTDTHESFYTKFGFKTVDDQYLQSTKVVIMEKCFSI